MALSSFLSTSTGGAAQLPGSRPSQDFKIGIVEFVFTEVDDIIEKIPDIDKIYEEAKSDGEYDEKNALYYGAIRYRTPEQQETKEEALKIAFPLDRYNFTLPVVGETIYVETINGKLFYKPLGFQSSPGFNTNLEVLLSTVKTTDSNTGTTGLDNFKEVQQTGIANTNVGNTGETKINQGFAGKYFKRNLKTHQLKPLEGDTIIQGKFGNSIRFSGYLHSDKTDGKQYPGILIRNGENVESQETNKIYSPTTEDINKDGTSIQITSGKYKTAFTETISVKKEAIEKYPSADELDGDQIIVNSGRVILSAKTSQLFLFSKKNLSIFTDSVITIDSEQGMNVVAQDGRIQFETKANNDIVWTVDNGKIFAGNDTATQQAILGNILVDLLGQLIDAIDAMTIATPSGPSAPGPIDKTPFTTIKNNLKTALSKTNYLI
jgi:hypothetical protein